jgi:CRP-like cAMP-binding protein
LQADFVFRFPFLRKSYKKMEEKRPSLSEIRKLIVAIPFFQGLAEESLEKAITHLALRNHPANRVILLENDWGGSVYFIIEGWVKIRTHNADGREITLNIVGKGEIIGEMAALEEAPRSTDAITLTATTICSIPSQDFCSLLANEPKAGIRLAQLIAKRLRQLNRRLRLREAESVERVADTLLFLAEGQGKSSQQGGIDIPNLPHRELSSISGLARETVTRTLTKLEKKGLIIRESDRICIPDLYALEELIT